MLTMQTFIQVLAILITVGTFSLRKHTREEIIFMPKQIRTNMKEKLQPNYAQFQTILISQSWALVLLRMTTKKKINKNVHMLEGNKRKDYLQVGWWNNKSGQRHLGKTTKDSLCLVLKKHDLDVIGISESNILKDDDKGTTKIKGYDTINDKVINSGRSRSSIYIKSKLKYQIRHDLMDDDTPEVWLEVELKGRKNVESILYCQFYREQSELRGEKSRPGSENINSQKTRIRKWMEKVASKVLSENKRIYIGGDFNSSLGGNSERQDVIGADIEEVLVLESGLDMLIKEFTHQEVKNGIPCNARTIDHIYSNSPEKTMNTRTVLESGSHHKLLLTRIMGKVLNKAPLQHKARQRSLYEK